MIARVLVAYLQSHANLTALVSSRIYPLSLPQEPTLPAITYRLVSDKPEIDHDGESGYALSRYQFDVYAATFIQADDCARVLSEALSIWHQVNSNYAAFAENRQNDFDPELSQYRVTLDFMIERED
jgi:hypothetical protein